MAFYKFCYEHYSKSSLFCSKIQLWFPEKIVDFLGWKTRENVVVLDFLAVDNFDFTRKIVKIILGEKLVKMLGFCQNWIFGQKFDFSNSVCELTYTFICSPNGKLSSEFMTHFLCIADAERSMLLPFDNFFARTICLLNALRGKFPSLLKYARDVPSDAFPD